MNDMPDNSNRVLTVRGLTKRFAVAHDGFGRPTKFVHAVNGVDLDIGAGETLGLVGESGCGKTTVGRSLLRLTEPSEGRAMFQLRDAAGQCVGSEVDLFTASQREMRQLRRRLQIVFQDPYSSLNPRLSVATNITEPLRAFGMSLAARRAKAETLLADVGLSPDQGRRFPHELSGGQRQRVAIARAIALDPQIVVADEPVSSLDVSIQAQVLNLLADIQKARGLALLFIAHNLAAVRYISQRIAVMYLGRIVEIAATDDLFKNPRHPYTRALIDAVPGMSGARGILPGEPPDPTQLALGCPFRPRCRFAQDICKQSEPALEPVSGSNQAACHFPLDSAVASV